MDIILNELERAKEIIQTGHIDKDVPHMLGILARYLLSIGKTKQETKDMLEEFIKKDRPRDRIDGWYGLIDHIVSKADGKQLVQIDSVNITKNELDIIKSINKRQEERLMFTILCLSKYWNCVNDLNNGWVNTSDKDIMRMANINTSISRQSAMFRNLKSYGFISFSKKVDNLNVKVDILDNDSDIEIKITDFRNLGHQYHMYRGEHYIQCVNCGITTKRNSSNHKYCKDCARQMYIKQTIESIMRKSHK